MKIIFSKTQSTNILNNYRQLDKIIFYIHTNFNVHMLALDMETRVVITFLRISGCH